MLLERARAWGGEIKAGLVENASALAIREGLTRARVSQILRLEDLAPSILEDISDPARTGPLPTEHQLRKITLMPNPREQVRLYRRYTEEIREPAKALPTPKQTRVYQRGFQHLFAKARVYREMCESGTFGSLREVGRSEGVSGERVGQLLALLTLAPEIISRLDVPAGERPEGIQWDDLRRLTKFRNPAEQIREFQVLLEPGQSGQAE